MSLDAKALELRADFPVLHTEHNGQSLVYLDNAATTQKPKQVADRLHRFYTQEYGTIHRGVYHLSQQATQFYDDSRLKVQSFIGAAHSDEVIFTRGTTESINLVASGYGRKFFKPGDEIVISHMEHHANIVPWQEVCKATGAVLKVAPINDAGELIWDDFLALLSDKTVMVAIVHVSNALGTINPVSDVIEAAHGVGAKVLIDGAQAVAHMGVDMVALDCDFYAFSGHKLYGPTGIGILYAKRELLDVMDPYQTGGDMIETVSFEGSTFAKPPQKFEAGTPAIAEPLGLAEAIDYIQAVGLDVIGEIEDALVAYATQKLQAIDGIRLIGTAENKASVVSFVLDDVHPHDLGTILDEQGVAIRAGHHCAQPVMRRFDVAATARASFSFYNSIADVDQLITGIETAKSILK